MLVLVWIVRSSRGSSVSPSRVLLLAATGMLLFKRNGEEEGKFNVNVTDALGELADSSFILID